MAYKLTVHNFVSKAGRSEDSIPSSSLSSTSSILVAKARELVATCSTTHLDASSAPKWRSVIPKQTRLTINSDRLYTYAHAPPRPISRTTMPTSQLISEWVQQSSCFSPSLGDLQREAEEELSLEDLEDFQSTNFKQEDSLDIENAGTPRQSTASKDSSQGLAVHRSYRKSPLMDSIEENCPSSKRLRLDPPSVPLLNLIKRPHHLLFPPKPLISTSSGSGEQTRRSDSRDAIIPVPMASFTPVPPHTKESLACFLRHTSARCAWIIPLSGTLTLSLPRRPAASGKPSRTSIISSAQFVSVLPKVSKPVIRPTSPQIRSSKKKDRAVDPMIYWTPYTVAQFWDFLLQLRSVPNQRLGGLSLVFQASPYNTQDHQKESSIPASHVPCSVNANGEEIHVGVRGLETCDHIKIFCEAGYAMYLRRVLSYWKLDAEDENDEGVLDPDGKRMGSTKERLAPLRFSRLALMDETWSVIAVC